MKTFPISFGIGYAEISYPDMACRMTDDIRTNWVYFFRFKNGALGVKCQNHDAPLMWDSDKVQWVTGRGQWYEDFELEMSERGIHYNKKLDT